MANSTGLLSNSSDGFLDMPQTKVEAPKVERPDDEINVCVKFNENSKEIFHLVSTFSALCASRQQKTRTHRIALLVLAPERTAPMRLGYCDELTANNLVYRLCLNAGVDCIVILNHELAKERVLKEDDLGKRPFRF